MKIIYITVVLALFVQSISCLECYECTHDEKEDDLDEGCKDNADDFSSSYTVTCDDDEDRCIFEYTVYEEENKVVYKRGCGSSKDYNDEVDSCYSYESFGVKYDECICDSDECNGSSGVEAAFVLVASAASLLLAKTL